MGIIRYLLSSKEMLSSKNPKQSTAGRIEDDLIRVGLQTLIHPSTRAPRIVHSYTGYTVFTARKPLPPSMFRSLVMDDVIGTESGDYMSSNVEYSKGVVDKSEPRRNGTRSRYRKTEMKEFPPPILLLTRTGGMPWIFKRQNIDGRLIMRAERMKRPECFEAHRLDGRLTMKLVPPRDDAAYCEDCGHPIADQQEESEDYEQEEVQSEGSWVQKSPVKLETEESEELCGCIGYDDGLVRDSDLFWKGRGIEGSSGCLASPSSAHFRPMTTVM